MTDLDFESDRLLVLLTDALKDGPGSPAWHEALTQLREAGVSGLEDSALLLRVREHLESGRSFRTIRAGGGFTQQVMRSIENESAAEPPKGNRLLLGFCAAIVVITVGVIATLLWRSAKTAEDDSGGSSVLIHTAASLDFDSGLPGDWQTIGALPLTTARGAVLPQVAQAHAGAGGGLAWNREIAADDPFSFSANYRLPHGGDTVAELFITDEPIFDATTGVTPHELVWLCQARTTSIILPSGQVMVQQPLPADTRNVIPVRLTINGPRVVIEQAGKQLWTGPHELGSGKRRTVGLRFLKASAESGEEFGFGRIRINTRPTNP